MDPPELRNFGSLIRFALELEGASASLYRAALALLRGGPQAELVRELAEQHDGRRALLERTRQQKLNEMVLEPISGLDGSRYVYDANVAGPHDILRQAGAIEEDGVRLYMESAVLAKSLLTEAARTFTKLADENRRNLARLREMFGS